MVQRWDLGGHVDGLTADPSNGTVIATTNEDSNARLFVITPSSPTAVEYKSPHLPSTEARCRRLLEGDDADLRLGARNLWR